MPVNPPWTWRLPLAALSPSPAPTDLLADPTSCATSFDDAEPGDGAAPMQPAAQARVIKKLHPGQPGSKKLHRRFGDALVCVRYRQDSARGMRYTTVELVVDQAPAVLVAPRAPVIPAAPTTPAAPARAGREPMVLIRIGLDETGLREQVKARGARWDRTMKAWYMPGALARAMHLEERILPQTVQDWL